MDRTVKKVGAAVVVGGGVGGMQAALDLADSGIKVYLVDRQSAIGGTMAQLDKTFPTNDCAMCTISPRLVSVGRHLNIEVIPNAEVVRIDGEAGDFAVTIHRSARYVDTVKCTGCGLCAEKCPISLPDPFNTGVSERRAIHKLYPQAVPGSYLISRRGRSPCKVACPAGVSAHGYVALIAQGRFAEALEIEKRGNPFPGICGRVCTHPCEKECNRGQVDQPVAIRDLKRFLGDWEAQERREGRTLPVPPAPAWKQQRVAIVGSGPSGLTMAADLARMGYRSTVFEALPRPGGILVWGIPPYRLPREVIDCEIEAVRGLGVEIRCNTRVGEDLSLNQLFTDGYDAVFLAVGAQQGLKLRVPGEGTLTGFEAGIDFLRRVNQTELTQGREPEPVIRLAGRRVAVVGGGNSAIDSARTALRLGAASVDLYCWETRDVMPAEPSEVEEALREGITMHHLVGILEILGRDGHVSGMRCCRIDLGPADEKGRFNPTFFQETAFDVSCDYVISAISQRPDLDFLGQDSGVGSGPGNVLHVNPVTGATSRPGVFAAGDAVTGPASVVEAIGAAHRAAAWVEKYLAEALPWEELTRTDLAVSETPLPKAELPQPPTPPGGGNVFGPLWGPGHEKRPRQEIPVVPPEERRGSFREVEGTLSLGQAMAEAARCLGCGICAECHECVKVCEAGAIVHDESPEWEEVVSAGAVILAPGFDLCAAEEKKEYGFGRYPNVLTALGFERMLSASGPTAGRVQRPSDGRPPGSLAFVSCLGSRDKEQDYCSSVCCMYAIKQAILAKEHEPDLEVTVFYIDLRAFGKGFDGYYERARELGIRFVRQRPSSIKQREPDRSLVVRVTGDGGELVNQVFDLVVLSTGLRPPADGEKIERIFGVARNNLGFARTDRWEPQTTSRPGVYVCGPFVEPKDIPETVTQASAAAADVMTELADARGTLIRVKQYPPLRPVEGQAPRIGVFICHCGKNIGGVIPVPSLLEAVQTWPDVAYAEDNLYTCSQDTQERIRHLIGEHNLNRVVVASCTPRTHEPLFQETLREAGLNPYLFEMANIRDQCTWVHRDRPEEASTKALDLIRMAVARARKGEPLYTEDLPVTKEVLVVGGGLAGMIASLKMAQQGFQVHLVEQSDRLGGMLWRIHATLEDAGGAGRVASERDRLISLVKASPRIALHLESRLTGFSGFQGNFAVTITTSEREIPLEVGAILVATGGIPYEGEDFGYGTDPRVVSQLDLEERLHRGELGTLREVVMIQCVGSRNQEHPYCSRICCAEAVKNALAIKRTNPATRVVVLYRDIRTYGLRERYYTEARKAGVIFVRYHEDRPPERTDGEGLEIKVVDDLTGSELLLTPDLLVLSLGTRPHPEGASLSEILKIPQTSEGFFLEAHMKLRPVDFASEGIFLAGLAHYPKFIDETAAQAAAAVGRIGTLLAHDTISVGGAIACVDPMLCAACLTCLRVCPYQVPRIQNGVAVIEAATCHGCGTCAGACPAAAIQVRHTKDDQVLAKLDALFGIEVTV